MNHLHIDAAITGGNSVTHQITARDRRFRAQGQSGCQRHASRSRRRSHPASRQRLHRQARRRRPSGGRRCRSDPQRDAGRGIPRCRRHRGRRADVHFTVSSQLKAWIDRIAVAGKTFRYTESGAQGLRAARRCSSPPRAAAIYSEGPAAAADFQEPFLRQVFAFLGIEDVTSSAPRAWPTVRIIARRRSTRRDCRRIRGVRARGLTHTAFREAPPPAAGSPRIPGTGGGFFLAIIPFAKAAARWQPATHCGQSSRGAIERPCTGASGGQDAECTSGKRAGVRESGPAPATAAGVAFHRASLLEIRDLPGGLAAWWDNLLKAGYPAFVSCLCPFRRSSPAALLLIPGVLTQICRLLAMPMMLGAAHFWMIRNGFFFTRAAPNCRSSGWRCLAFRSLRGMVPLPQSGSPDPRRALAWLRRRGPPAVQAEPADLP